jgi:hypothetical protein
MSDNSWKVKVLYVMFWTKPGWRGEIDSRFRTSTALANVEEVVAFKRARRADVTDFQMNALSERLIVT